MYLGIHKGGPNFRWPLVSKGGRTTQRRITQRGEPSFPIFSYDEKICFLPKGGHGPMAPPPKYATGGRANFDFIELVHSKNYCTCTFFICSVCSFSPGTIQTKNISRGSFSDGKMRLVSISSYDEGES